LISSLSALDTGRLKGYSYAGDLDPESRRRPGAAVLKEGWIAMTNPDPDAQAETQGASSDADSPQTQSVWKTRFIVGLIACIILVGSGVAMCTGWFGFLEPKTQKAVVGCKHCGHALLAEAGRDLTCPKCGKANALCPIARCQNCGHVFLFGESGAGTECPQCGASNVEPVTNLAAAGDTWKHLSVKPKPKAPNLGAQQSERTESQKGE